METFLIVPVAWYSKDSLGAASDLYLRENNLIAEITACCSIFPPSSVFKQERGCFCELQIIQIEEINKLGVFSSVGTCTWQKKKTFGECQKMGYQIISTIIAFGIYFYFGIFTYFAKAC